MGVEVNLTKRRACAALPPSSGISSHPDSAGFVLILVRPSPEVDGSIMPALECRNRGR